MKLNINTIFDELTTFNPKLIGSSGTDSNLRGVRLYVDGRELSPEYIYVSNTTSFVNNLESFIGYDFIILGEYDEYEIDNKNSAIFISDDVLIKDDIVNIVSEIFEKYAEWDSAMISSIATKRGMQATLDIASGMLSNPFAIFDSSAVVLYVSGTFTGNIKGTVWEGILNGSHSKDKGNEELYHSLMYEREKTDIREPFIFTNGKYKDQIQYCLGIKQGDFYALLGTVELMPITRGEIAKLKHVRNIIELAFLSNTEYSEMRKDVVFYIQNLLQDISVEDKVIQYHLHTRNWKQSDTFQIYNISKSSGQAMAVAEQKYCIFSIDKAIRDKLIFSYESSLICIHRITQNQALDDDGDFLTSIYKPLVKLDMRCGISLPFSDFSRIRFYYIQSKAAISEAAGDPKTIFCDFSEYYLSYLRHSVEAVTSIESLIHPKVYELWCQDAITSDGSINCLKTYLTSGCNVSQTSRRVYLHRNTLLYRLEKITDFLAIDLATASDHLLFHLLLSCHLCNLLDK